MCFVRKRIIVSEAMILTSGPMSVLLTSLSVSDQVSLLLTQRQLRRTEFFYKAVPSFSVRKMVLSCPVLVCEHLTHLMLRFSQMIPDEFLDQLPTMVNLVHLEISTGMLLYAQEGTIPPNVETFIQSDSYGGARFRVTNLRTHNKLRVLKLRCFEYRDFAMPPNLIECELPSLDHKYVQFPESLELLQFALDYNFPVDALGPNLKTWHCGMSWNHPLPRLPETLQTLCLSTYFTGSLDNVPNSIQNITLSSASNGEFVRIIAMRHFANLRELRMHEILNDHQAELLSQNAPHLTSLRLQSCAAKSKAFHLPLLIHFYIQTWSCGDPLASFTHFSCLQSLEMCILSETTTDIEFPESLRICKIRAHGEVFLTSYSFLSISIPRLPPGLRTLNLKCNGYLNIPELHRGLIIVDISCTGLLHDIKSLPASVRVYRLRLTTQLGIVCAPVPNMDFFQCNTRIPQINTRYYPGIPVWGML